MKLSLCVLSKGKREGTPIAIRKSPFLIGRDPDCQLRPNSQFVSHRHCAILLRGEQAFVRDFDSTNGTFLNEQAVQGEVELKDGDQLRIAALLFRVTLEASTPPNRPTPMPPLKQPSAVKGGASDHPSPTPPTLTPEADGPQAAVDDEEGAAALLLSLENTEETGVSEPGADNQGSTVEEAISDQASEDTKESGKEANRRKPSAAVSESADTTSAARAILRKYIWRQRG